MKVSDASLEVLHQEATSIFQDALSGCNITSAFDRRLRFEGDRLTRLIPGENGPDVLDLKAYRRIFVIAIGKAAVPMLETLFARMERRSGVRGICCSIAIPEKRNWRVRYFEGGHPLPNEDSLAAARAALALLGKARKDTLVLYLISGGGSALFDLPLDPAITMEDSVAFHNALLGCGAPIHEINTLRKHFSAVKGGRLAIAAGEAAKLSILLPDVPLRSLDALASGPTFPDSTTVDDVRTLLDKYDLLQQFPPRVRTFFAGQSLPESPGKKRLLPPLMTRLKSRENVTEHERSEPSRDQAFARPSAIEDRAFRNSMYEVLLSSHDLVDAARLRSERAGFHTVVDNSCDDWDYAEAARYLLDRFHAIRRQHPRCCLISGGEVTVTLDRSPGAGGRNQQFALLSALELAQYSGSNLVVFSAGSDGIDGNTRAAGAIADTSTVRRAAAFGYNACEALAAFDACPLFTSLGDAVVTGPTGHNLRDLRLLISDEMPGTVELQAGR